MDINVAGVDNEDNIAHYKWWVYVPSDGQRCIVHGIEHEPYTPPPDWQDRIKLLQAAWDGSAYPLGAHIPGVGYITGVAQCRDDVDTILYLFERP